jgi:hypothetical protein
MYNMEDNQRPDSDVKAGLADSLPLSAIHNSNCVKGEESKVEETEQKFEKAE